MSRIFISHASSDRDLAREVFGWLLSDGHELFYDQELTAGLVVGDPWEARLRERLRWADAVVCLVTTPYVSSAWCSAEVALAMSYGCRVLPVVAEIGVVHPLLRGLQSTDFARDPAVARQALNQALRPVAETGGGWDDLRSPFPGLRPFETDMHRAFFGRDDEVRALSALTRAGIGRVDRGVLVVTGPSGSGKSSLARAGLIPAIAAEKGWSTIYPVLPGADPIAAVAREITAAGWRLGSSWSLTDVRARLAGGDPSGVVEEILLHAVGPGSRRGLLIVVDQLEEVLTHTSPGGRREFADLIAATKHGPLRIVATLRPEYLAPLLADPDLHDVRVETFTLRPLGRDQLSEVVVRPAELAGFRMEPALVAKLVDDTGGGEALPLLAFTLQQLTIEVTRGGSLSTAQYQLLGGVPGALTTQADAALADAIRSGHRTAPDVIRSLLRLVAVDDLGQVVRARCAIDDLPAVNRTELDAFTARRLLTTDLEDSRPVVGVAHEAFLTSWKPLADAIEAEETALRMRGTVERAARDWDAAGRPKSGLWERGQLAGAVEALVAAGATASVPMKPTRASPPNQTRSRRKRMRSLRPSTRVELADLSRTFLSTSIKRDRIRRGRATSILALLLVAALVAGAVAFLQRQAAQDQTRLANAAKDLAAASQRLAAARQLLAQSRLATSDDVRNSVRLAIAAYQLSPDEQTQAGLLQAVSRSRIASSLIQPAGSVDRPGGSKVVVDGAGTVAATGWSGGPVILWNVEHSEAVTKLQEIPTRSPVSTLAMSPNGRLLVIGGFDGSVEIWSIADPVNVTEVGRSLSDRGTIWSMTITDRGILAIGALKGRVDLFQSIQSPLTYRTIQEGIAVGSLGEGYVALSPDGRTLAVTSSDRHLNLWDVSVPSSPRSGPRLPGYGPFAFSADAHLMVSSGTSGGRTVWDLSDPSGPLAASTIPSGAGPVAFNPNGSTLVAGGPDFTLVLWDLSDVHRPTQLGEPLVGHKDEVRSVAFGRNGMLATGSFDRTVILWDVDGAAHPTQLGDPLPAVDGGVHDLEFVPGHRIVVEVASRAVALWNVTDLDPPRILSQIHRDSSFNSVSVSPDGKFLVTTARDQYVEVWDITNPTKPKSLESVSAGGRIVALAADYSSDGGILAIGGTRLSVVLWNVTATGQLHELGRTPDQNYNVLSVAFSHDGRMLATGRDDRTVVLYDVGASGLTPVGGPLEGHGASVTDVAFSPDDQIVASRDSDGTFRLWQAESGLPISEPVHGPSGFDSGLEFSPDGQLLVISTAGQTELWDLTDIDGPVSIWRSPLRLNPGGGDVAFSTDGTTYAATDTAGRTSLWSLAGLADLRSQLLLRACSIAGRGLTAEEWARLVPGEAYQSTCAR